MGSEFYFQEKNINWWKTPASSPDINPIKNVWGSMKNHVRTNVKPKNLQELKGRDQGILVDADTCSLPKVHWTLKGYSKGHRREWWTFWVLAAPCHNNIILHNI